MGLLESLFIKLCLFLGFKTAWGFVMNRQMASNYARNVVRRAISSTKNLVSRGQSSYSLALESPELTGLPRSIPRLTPRRRPLFSSRIPVELGSLMPLHSATASALLNSMLSSEVGNWGFLSEGFATPL